MIQRYPYLFSQALSLLMLACAIALIRPRRWARDALLSGLLCIPASLLSVMHEGAYWTPRRIGGWSWGIEDVMFTCASGVLAWLCATLLNRHRSALEPRPGVFARSAWLVASGAATYVALRAVGIGSIGAHIYSAVAPVTILLWCCARMWRLAVAGLAVFTPVYLLIVKLHFLLWPDYSADWNAAHVWGRTVVLGIPLAELLWACVFGFTWPLVVVYIVSGNRRKRDFTHLSVS